MNEWSHQSWQLVLLCILHSVVSYGIILWGNSTDSSKVFISQIKSFSLMGGIKQGVSCRRLCNIFHLESVYQFSLLLFIVNKMEILKRICKATV